MLTSLAAVTPIFLAIALGWVLKARFFPQDQLWSDLQRLCYFVFFPILLFFLIAKANLETLMLRELSTAFFFSVFSLVAVLLILRRPIMYITGTKGAGFTSIFQGSIRWNGFVALATIASLYNGTALSISALAFLIIVLTTNAFSVIVLLLYGENNHSGFSSTIVEIIRNPIISAGLVGLAFNLAGLELPGPIMKSFEVIGAAAMPLALLGVGAGLKLHEALEARTSVLLSSLFKLLAFPFIMLMWTDILGIDGIARSVAIICCAIPTSASSFILAKQLGGDTSLMASIITGQTLLSILSLPVIIAFFG